MSIDVQRYAALTLQSLRVTIGPLQASTTSLESPESYLTAGMLPYNRNVTLQTFLSSTRDFYRLHSTFARLYNAAASRLARWQLMKFIVIVVDVCCRELQCLLSVSGNVMISEKAVAGRATERSNCNKVLVKCSGTVAN